MENYVGKPVAEEKPKPVEQSHMNASNDVGTFAPIPAVERAATIELNTSNDQDHPSSLNKLAEAASLPASAAAGVLYTRSTVSDQTYNKLRNIGAFDDKRGIRQEKAKELFPAWEETKDIAGDLNKLNRAHALEIDQRMERIGYGTFTKQFKALHPNQQAKAVAEGLTAFGIIYSIFAVALDHDHSWLKKLINKRDQQPDAQEAQR